MNRFERNFSQAQNAAESTLIQARNLATRVRRLQKAAKDGNIANIKKAQGAIDSALRELSEEVDRAVRSWPLAEEEEERYLKDGYAAELQHAAREKHLTIREQEGKLVSYPSIVEILPGERAVTIDKKKIRTLRPTRLVELLIRNRDKTRRFRSTTFLRSLYSVYSELVKAQSTAGLFKGRQGPVLPLLRIYTLLTSLPGVRRKYSRTDFARDLYELDRSGETTLKSGATVSFSASTGTRSTRGVFSFIGPDGQIAQYYGIRFTRKV